MLAAGSNPVHQGSGIGSNFTFFTHTYTSSRHLNTQPGTTLLVRGVSKVAGGQN